MNLTHVWALEHAKDTDEWEMMLYSPLPGEAMRVTPETAEVEGQGFMDAMAVLSGKG